jgi:hypothetical protein
MKISLGIADAGQIAELGANGTGYRGGPVSGVRAETSPMKVGLKLGLLATPAD